jgi:hypothetical protein
MRAGVVAQPPALRIDPALFRVVPLVIQVESDSCHVAPASTVIVVNAK